MDDNYDVHHEQIQATFMKQYQTSFFLFRDIMVKICAFRDRGIYSIIIADYLFHRPFQFGMQQPNNNVKTQFQTIHYMLKCKVFVKEELLSFGLLIAQKKQFEGITFGSG